MSSPTKYKRKEMKYRVLAKYNDASIGCVTLLARAARICVRLQLALALFLPFPSLNTWKVEK
jgi:hypothetical protein